MKNYAKETVSKLTALELAADVLKDAQRSVKNPADPIIPKLTDALAEIEQFSESRLSYPLLRSIFEAWERGNPDKHLTAYIVFKDKESWGKEYPLVSRTYCISSDNKAFQSGKGGYSIFGHCLDGTDPCIRLDSFMRCCENPWKVDYCILLGERN